MAGKQDMAAQAMKKIDKYQFSMNHRIGSGSYANVYKGEDKETGKVVAIKMINRQKISQEDYLMNGLLQEIQIMKKLKSDYIVKLIDVLETKNNYYIVQEYCDQGDFRHYLNTKGFLDEKEAKQVLVNLLSGFLELLKHGIIHRDLKPENILISTKNKQTGELIFKLADFGFSRTVDNFRRQLLKSLVGTPLYMSPQILMFQKYTSKSDIWSIGLIFYEMLYGKMPWIVQSQYQLVEMIKKGTINWIMNANGSTTPSEQAINFMYKCLQVEEEKRIQWDDIYAHPLFGDYFSHFLEKNKNLEDKALYLINNLRQKIHSTNTDLLELFSHFDLTNESKLDIKEFEQLMKQIDTDLNREEIEYIFNKFDSDGDNKIDFTEFQKWLENNNIRLSMHNSQLCKRQIIDQKLDEELKLIIDAQQQLLSQQSEEKDDSYQDDLFNEQSPSQKQEQQPMQQQQKQQKQSDQLLVLQQQQQQSQRNKHADTQELANSSPSETKNTKESIFRKFSSEEKAMIAIGKLRLAIEKYQIDKKELFSRYDKNNADSLSLHEFTRMIKKIDDKLVSEEIELAFKKFDTSSTGKITFAQFLTTIENISNSVHISVKHTKSTAETPKDQKCNYESAPNSAQ